METQTETNAGAAVTLQAARRTRMLGWNVEERADGLYYCEGLHERSQPCEWEKLTDDVWRELVTEPKEAAAVASPTLFQCPKCNGPHFNVGTDGTLICASVSKHTGCMVKPGGCGWSGTQK